MKKVNLLAAAVLAAAFAMPAQADYTPNVTLMVTSVLVYSTVKAVV